MTFYLPELKAFCGAELVSKNLHNLYTLRGTKVRDAVKWSGYINEAMTLFDDAEVYFGSHHWPTWGQPAIQQFLQQQKDTYKYIHDQSVRMINKGFTPAEIAEAIELPESLAKTCQKHPVKLSHWATGLPVTDAPPVAAHLLREPTPLTPTRSWM